MKQTVQVHDSRALAEVLKSLVDRGILKRSGHDERTLPGLSRTTIWRLLSDSERAELKADTYYSLLTLLDQAMPRGGDRVLERLRERLEDATLSPLGALFCQHFATWSDYHLRDYLLSDEGYLFIAHGQPSRFLAEDDDRPAREVGELRAKLHGPRLARWRNYKALLDRIRQLPAQGKDDRAQEYLDRMRESWRLREKGSLGAARAEAATIRALLPLLQGSDSGLIEARWEDLSDAELARFVRHSVERELVLLRARPHSAQRARQVVSGELPDTQFDEWSEARARLRPAAGTHHRELAEVDAVAAGPHSRRRRRA